MEKSVKVYLTDGEPTGYPFFTCHKVIAKIRMGLNELL